MQSQHQVLPACAGMIPLGPYVSPSKRGTPRMRGDDPALLWNAKSTRPCSPHARR